MKDFLEDYVYSFLETYYEDANYDISEEEKIKIMNKCVDEISNDDYVWQIIDDIILKNLK